MKKYYFEILLFFTCLIFLMVNIRMNLFSYHNFDFGKFDLGNMSQMLWYTLHGKLMYLTDYFGSNIPRWAMSHVDPILLLFIPFFVIFQHPLTLVFSQVVLIIFSSFLIFAIANLHIKEKFVSFLIAVSYLCYPALGYITAKTGFHGVSAAIFFFLLAFYIYERMYFDNNFSLKRFILFWVFLVITMSGKEQIPLYIFLYSVFILLFRTSTFHINSIQVKNALIMMLVSVIWLVTTFFIIIPAFAHFRVASYNNFTKLLEINDRDTRDVNLSNYFLSRYEIFGDSYTDIIINAVTKPSLTVNVLFGGDRLENLKETFQPVLYIPVIVPAVFVMAIPDLFINYLTSASGIGTGEISNHRISMIIPILFLSVIFFIAKLKLILESRQDSKKVTRVIVSGFSIILLGTNIYSSFSFNNPVLWWMKDAASKRIPQLTASAKTDLNLAKDTQIKQFDVVKTTNLENKDRECAAEIVKTIPPHASVSGPDYLGAHLSLRETYAIFPAIYDSADYVIADVFSKKILSILDIEIELIRKVINKIINDPSYQLQTSCGNLIVFKHVKSDIKESLLPIQERYKYEEKFNKEIFSGLTLVDFEFPLIVQRENMFKAKFIYLKKDPLDNFILYTNFINIETGDVHQTVNLPSYALLQTKDWVEDRYYVETLDFNLPVFLKPGEYKVLLGMTNFVKTRSLYLGNVRVK